MIIDDSFLTIRDNKDMSLWFFFLPHRSTTFARLIAIPVHVQYHWTELHQLETKKNENVIIIYERRGIMCFLLVSLALIIGIYISPIYWE